jgi:hypothetical protein
VYGVFPPPAVNVRLYATPIWPSGRLVVVTTRSAGTRIESDFVAVSAGVCESVTFTVKFDVPEEVGVPLMTPPELKVSPVGRLPDTVDHAYGV